MRSRTRDKQKTWYAKVTEKQVGIDTVPVYSNPEMVKLTVSANTGTSDELGAGLVPDYDKVMTSFKPIPVEEGYVWWIDREPKLDDGGNLLLKDDGYTPVTPPDYRLKRIISTQKGIAIRYGVVLIGGN